MDRHPDHRAAPDLPWLRDATTLRVGGPVAAWMLTGTERTLVDAVRHADQDRQTVLVLGGGSNLFASDEPHDAVVVQDVRRQIRIDDDPAGGGPIEVTATAGTRWDDLVAETLDRGLSGLEALSGIPGTVGAAPVQNIGAYGHDVAQTLVSVRAWDRAVAQVVVLSRAQLGLGYRTSVIKRSLAGSRTAPAESAGHVWGPTGRWVVLEATFALQESEMSAPVLYAELARHLGVQVGDTVPAHAVRAAVLELRRSKGMVLDDADHDTWSAGSFFTNPILTARAAATLLPPGAPRFPAGRGPQGEPLVKTSAAWLIDHAGFGRGYALGGVGVGSAARDGSVDEGDADGSVPPASLSTKHVLALTNRGRATSADIEALARTIREGVSTAFGIELVLEPVTLGIDL